MINSIEARNFRSLRYINQQLGPFQVQVGPNASGKTTFQDVIRFLGILVERGLEAAITTYSSNSNLRELFWNHQGNSFELAVECRLASFFDHAAMRERDWDTLRYEIEVGFLDGETPAILNEKGILFQSEPEELQQLELFPRDILPPEKKTRRKKQERRIFGKTATGNDVFYAESEKKAGKGWVVNLRLGGSRSALGGIPEDPEKFAVAIAFRNLLRQGVQSFVLNSQAMRMMCPPSLDGNYRFKPDGSNLPWVVDKIRSLPNFQAWIRHIQTALPDIADISIGEREDIRHKYLIVHYKNGPRVPSWLVSDGTLRLLALTLPAYLPDFRGVFLLEEPENGIHPRAVETVFQSLKSMYNAQVMVATHSPVILSICEASDILCFAKKDGATDIVRGDRHPALQNWKGSPDLAVLFGSGVLG